MPRDFCVCEELRNYFEKRLLERYKSNPVPPNENNSSLPNEDSSASQNKDGDEDSTMPISIDTENKVSGRRRRIKTFRTIAKFNWDNLSTNVIKRVAPKVGNMFRCRVRCDGKSIVLHGRYQSVKLLEVLQKMLQPI